MTLRDPDMLAVAGGILLVVGLAFAWWPLAIIAAGCIMLIAAVLIAWANGRGPEDDAG